MNLIARHVAEVEDLIGAYALRMGAQAAEDPGDYLSAFISDLRHWAAAHDVSFDAAWNIAESHWRSGIGGEEDRDLDLARTHPALHAQLINGGDLLPDEWDAVHAALDVPAVATAIHAPHPLAVQPDPPHGILDNVYRAARVDDVMDAFAARIDMTHEPSHEVLMELLVDLCHYGMAHRITMAPALPAYLPDDDPGAQAAHLRTVLAPWQEGMRFFIEELTGVDTTCTTEQLRLADPARARIIDGFMHARPRTAALPPFLSRRDWRALNQLAYWQLNADVPDPDLPTPEPLANTLFGPGR